MMLTGLTQYTTITKWLEKPVRSLYKLHMPYEYLRVYACLCVSAHKNGGQVADRHSVPSLSPLFIIYCLIALLAGWLLP